MTMECDKSLRESFKLVPISRNADEIFFNVNL